MVDTNRANQMRAEQLGMPWGTAQNRLRKLILFDLLQKHDENHCFKCTSQIETPEELSIEHKQPWNNVSIDLFWDLQNIAFSHLKCNRPDNPRRSPHGSQRSYVYGCRCDKCTEANNAHARLARSRYKAIHGITRPR